MCKIKQWPKNKEGESLDSVKELWHETVTRDFIDRADELTEVYEYLDALSALAEDNDHFCVTGTMVALLLNHAKTQLKQTCEALTNNASHLREIV